MHRRYIAYEPDRQALTDATMDTARIGDPC